MFALRGVRLTGKLVDRCRSEREGHALGQTGDGLSLSGGEQSLPMLSQQAGELTIGLRRGQGAQGILDFSPRLEPVRRSMQQGPSVLGRPGHVRSAKSRIRAWREK